MAMSNRIHETPEVLVKDRLIPLQDFDEERNSVCLLKSSSEDPAKYWTATGFYVNVTLKKKRVHCIMTCYHVFQLKKEQNDGMVAVFHYESPKKESIEIPLVPFTSLATNKVLDYVLIRVDHKDLRDRIKAAGVNPILVDETQLPSIKRGDTVYIIQHPGGKMKHFSQDTVRLINPPYIEYFADTEKGSSGSPVFVLQAGSSSSLVAMHTTGVDSNWNKGVLISDILLHLQTGHVTTPALPTLADDPVIPDQLESGVSAVVGTKDPSKRVSETDIIYIANDISEVWKELGLALGHANSTLSQIDMDNGRVYQKCYRMLLQWIQEKWSNATYGALSKGFANPTVRRDDLIKKFC